MGPVSCIKHREASRIQMWIPGSVLRMGSRRNSAPPVGSTAEHGPDNLDLVPGDGVLAAPMAPLVLGGLLLDVGQLKHVPDAKCSQCERRGTDGGQAPEQWREGYRDFPADAGHRVADPVANVAVVHLVARDILEL